jgi:hypothetical protein
MTRFGIVLGTAALLAWSAYSRAATLDQEACARLKTELMQLELAGTRNSMSKGPEWAKANLASDKLQQIKRLLDIEEQILFRCQGKPLVVLPEGVDAEPAPAESKAGAPAKPAAGKEVAKDAAPAAGKTQGKAAPAANAKAASTQPAKGPAAKAGPAKAASEPPPVPKPKPKPKVDDAYKPAPAAPAGPAPIKP